MRRLAFAAVCGTLVLAACSDQTPTEPTAPPPEQFISPTCQPSPHFPIVQVSGLILKVFPRGKLQLEALARAGAIALFWETCKKAAAQRAAVDFVNFMNANSSRLTGTANQQNTLINLILGGVGLPFTVPTESPDDFGIGVFDPAKTTNTLVKTKSGVAFVELEPESFNELTFIKVARKSDDFELTDFGGNQFPPTFDYDAANASGDHVLKNGKKALVAFCLLDSDVQTYPANLRIGHNPVVGAPGFPFEILEVVDLAAERPTLYAELIAKCPALTPNTTFLIGGFGQGLPGVANAAWRTARYYLAPVARTLLLPEALHAAALAVGTLPPPAGRAPSLSPFRVVDATNFFGFENGEQEWTPTGFWNRNTLTGLMNTAFPTYVSTVGNALPAPFAGSFAAWYGQSPSGNFLATQVTGDPAGSGGTSTTFNTGSFLSPTFTVPDGTNPVELRLKTWWEIEGVNPANFDLMDIVLRNNATGAQTVLKRLNPASDPESPADRSPLAYTSGGFNTAPVWQDVVIDLSAYRGETVQLRFVFNTGDARYNGFRGWIVDQVVVTGGSPSLSIGGITQQSSADLVPADQEAFPVRTQEP